MATVNIIGNNLKVKLGFEIPIRSEDRKQPKNRLNISVYSF